MKIVEIFEARKCRNKEILKKFFAGESLCLIPAAATWFPPRPIIKKDKKEIERLYGKDENER